MYKKKRFMLFIALLLVLILMSGCSDNQATTEVEQEEIRIALFIVVRANDYDEARILGMKSKLAEYNARLDVFSCEFDTLEQINQIQDAITAGVYDAFVIVPNDSNAVVPAVQDALDAGIIVIAAEAPFGLDTRSLLPYPEGVSSVIGRTGWTTGEWLGKAVVEAAANFDEAKVAYLIGMQALKIDQDRFEGLVSVITEHPNIEIVAFQEGEYRRDISFEVMQNVFQANPGINIVVSSGDQMTLGAHDAAVELGIEDQILFIGSGASREGIEAVADGRFFATYADIPFTQGQLLTRYAVKAVRGENVPKFINLEELSPPLPEKGPIIKGDDVFESEW